MRQSEQLTELIEPEVRPMDTVLVTGGTGHLGRDVVARLKPTHRVRVLSRYPGSDPDVEWIRGDLATGEGIAAAVAGAQVVVHAATLSPAAKRGYLLPADLWRSPPEVDVDGTRRLLEAADRAGVRHFAHVSIVGVDRPRVPYMRVKHTAEDLVRAGKVPWSILRATQFHWLADRILGKAARLPVMPWPTELRTQPVDSRDFADHLVRRVAEGPGGQDTDFGGPEVLTLGELLAQWQQIRGRRRRVLKLPVPAVAERAARDLTCPDGTRGTVTWAEWLRTHAPE
ncbi:SDR family oxidoreductase [Streptomyces sp. NPDC046712]|uniref:SDR family oxidoreductase n=1 Tax=Streptomyces sp. NPDC046712 TaxID=3154802 RepID=UPI0033ED2D8F